MRLSIAMATWNGRKYIERQLDSLRLQTRPADEVLISDDASGDGTAAYCRAYIARYGLPWRVLENERTVGYQANFACAVSQTTGDWVFLCDQDDVWEVDKLARVEAIIRDHGGAAAVLHSFSRIDGQGNAIAAPASPWPNHGLMRLRLPAGVCRLPGPGAAPEYLLMQNVAMGCCTAVSRAVCQRWLRLTRFGFPHDWELLICAFYSGELWYTDRELIRYRLHGANAIGLRRAEGSRRPSLEGRRRIMAEYEEIIAGAERIRADLGYPPLAEGYARFNALRRDALERRSLWRWLGLVRYRRYYATKFSWKQRLGDVCLILLGQRGGEKRRSGREAARAKAAFMPAGPEKGTPGGRT